MGPGVFSVQTEAPTECNGHSVVSAPQFQLLFSAALSAARHAPTRTVIGKASLLLLAPIPRPIRTLVRQSFVPRANEFS